MSTQTDFISSWAAAQTAMVQETARNFQRVSRLPSLWRRARKVKKGATPSEVVYEEDRLKLLHYVSDEPPRYRTPVLFVFALVNRPYVLDLLPGKSVIEKFVQAGFDTYLIDWHRPTHADRHHTLDTYVNGYIRNIVDHLRERTGAPRVSLVGYCMGGTMSTLFTALHPEKVANLVLMAAGIDFETREGLLNLWSDEENFDVDAFVDAFGNCPAEFLQSTFQMMNPVANYLQKPLNFFERMDDEAFVEEFFTMETWLNDNVSIPGEVYREFVKYLYQRNLLVKNQMPVGRHLVNLRNIVCPVLNLMASRDDLVPCAQSEPFTDLVGSADRKTMKLETGHIGLAVGKRAHQELWPKVCDWLGERS
ncbi:MAG: class III poly(R)-hydroxyalkanoic acid synthase subunit PhaC [Verrucomicrobiae bacterium]|nr:class III poly(R)-hydroxyalkanoic acid synthase subunit PhaC [Verrucomicrobiae bacterium]